MPSEQCNAGLSKNSHIKFFKIKCTFFEKYLLSSRFYVEGGEYQDLKLTNVKYPELLYFLVNLLPLNMLEEILKVERISKLHLQGVH